MDFGLQAEREAMAIGKQNRIKELVTIRRNRNAMIGSEIVMFMQQFCGVNVIAYYSSEIFLDAQLPETSALAASLGFGIINWLFAIPAVYSESSILRAAPSLGADRSQPLIPLDGAICF